MFHNIFVFYKRFRNLIIKSSKYILFFQIIILLFSSYHEIPFFFIKLFLSKNIINEYKAKLCICTIGKEENKYIKEFVNHYKALGVDKIFLYDNNDINGENFENILSEYIKDGFIEIFNKRGKIQPQLKVYEECYNKNKKNYDWFIFFDIDEFIHLDNYSSINGFLSEKKFEKCKLIYFNCLRHSDNNQLFYDNRTLKERFPIILWNSTMYTLKTIMRGNFTKNIKFTTSHWLNRGLKDGCDVEGNKVIPKRSVKIGNKINHILHKSYYIDHYCFKSTEEYINKINKGDGIFGYSNRIKMHKLNIYFGYNKITIEKINLIENKTGLNLRKFKLKIKKK